MERVSLYAKPSATDAKPHSFYVSSALLSSVQIITVNLFGKSFFSPRNLYLSASDVELYNGLSYSYFNPFSAFPKLSGNNLGFTAYVIPEFTLIGENKIVFDIPNNFLNYIFQKTQYSAYIDVIVENEAGYGLLSRDSYSYTVSSWSGFTLYQKPSTRGLFIASV
jgi:hypothetical protein